MGSATNANSLAIDFAGSTQYGTASSLNTLSQDGYASGNLIGVSTDEHGVVSAKYSNGASTILGEVALARFQNNQGLTKLGDSRWAENTSSGSAVYGEAGVGDFGVIHAGALEASNVDMATQLVQLIVAQQMYQANTQSIQTQNQIMQSVLNVR
ncbi:flagellar hook-basal body complex protein [Methylogaea oryzae]|uniref:flagellar hook-basal body complex protein n=1 Tax=Methylogaea oryzae TaxID=1295382 RepID=UPI0020D1137D|nr:flagellar hook-basal body complex protein [Methylogaea oryzae]